MLNYLRSIWDGKITLEEARKITREFKIELNSIAKEKYRSQGYESVLRNIKMLYKAREKIIDLFDDYSIIIWEAKHASLQRRGLKI